MKEVIADMVRHVAPHFPNMKITGTDESTKIEAHTDEKDLFLVGYLKDTLKEFEGEFGLGDLGLLKGLLEFPSYKSDEAKFKLHRAVREQAEVLSEIEFRDKNGAGTKYRTMHSRMVDEQAKIANITWDLSVSPSKAKVTEMVQLAGLLAQVDKMFGLLVEDGMLYMTIGGGSEVTHAATISLLENVDGKLLNSNTWLYNTPHFLSVLKSVGNDILTINFCSRGVIGVTVETDKAVYTYYLRGKQA